jgi:F-type H+-transporting ATPase subunit epsilon
MLVEILSPDNTLFTGEASLVTLPGSNGSFQIKNNHAAFISSLTEGIVEVKTDQTTENFPVTGGLVEVLSNKVIVLV